MFRCQLCDVVVRAGTRSHRVIVQTRPKVYEPRGTRPFHGRPPQRRGRRGKPKRSRNTFDKGGVGSEIVRELMICPDCARQNGDRPPVST